MATEPNIPADVLADMNKTSKELVVELAESSAYEQFRGSEQEEETKKNDNEEEDDELEIIDI